MKPYKFPSPASEYGPARDDAEIVMRSARSLQYLLADIKRNDFNWIAEKLNWLRQHDAWNLFPPDSPARTPKRMLQIISGKDPDELIKALKVIAEEDWAMISWIDDFEGIAIEAENFKRGAPVGNTNAAIDADKTKAGITRFCSEGKPEHNDTNGIKRRLYRKNPELLQEVLAGKISVNQAAIEAGMRKPRVSFSVGADAESVALLIAEKCGIDFFMRLAAAMSRATALPDASVNKTKG